jgi:protein-L-isoaspartate(D-aspartate) O-methyltransferase
MTELLELTGREKVLEIGAGSGYQTAVLANLSRAVFAIERLPNLADTAKTRLKQLGLLNVSLKCDDGTSGWPMYAPFDAILVAAGSPQIPEPLIGQLKVGGCLVIPIGRDQKTQVLIRVIRTEAGYSTENFGPCSFVPLIGQFGWESK